MTEFVIDGSIVHLGPRRRFIKYGERLFTVEFDRLERNPERTYSGNFADADGIPSKFIDALSGNGLGSVPALVTRLAELERGVGYMQKIAIFLVASIIVAFIGWGVQYYMG